MAPGSPILVTTAGFVTLAIDSRCHRMSRQVGKSSRRLLVKKDEGPVPRPEPTLFRPLEFVAYHEKAGG